MEDSSFLAASSNLFSNPAPCFHQFCIISTEVIRSLLNPCWLSEQWQPCTTPVMYCIIWVLLTPFTSLKGHSWPQPQAYPDTAQWGRSDTQVYTRSDSFLACSDRLHSAGTLVHFGTHQYLTTGTEVFKDSHLLVTLSKKKKKNRKRVT